jgi:CheY-like chemotaxis protein
MGVRVLVAEDEALIALSLADLLEAEGYDVAIAPDGADALDAARQMGDALRVLVTDLNMPCMDGEDLIRALRSDRPGLPVVVVTGSAPFGGVEEMRRRAGGDGPLLLLLKPPCYAELASALRRAAAADAAARASQGAAAYTPEAARRVDLAS